MDRTMIHCPNIDLKSAFRNFKSAILASPWPFALGAVAALLVAPCSWVQAQQAHKYPRIGFLSSASREQFAHDYVAFLQGLHDLGYIEGKNIVIESLWAEGKSDRLSDLAAELVSHNVDVIVSTGGTVTAFAAKKATKTIPIVFTAGGDLEKIGLISSLARPGGNLTGLSLLTVELNGKRLELLKETFPQIRRVAMLGNPGHPAYTNQVKEAQAAAKVLDLQLLLFEAGPDDFESAFAAMTKTRRESVAHVR